MNLKRTIRGTICLLAVILFLASAGAWAATIEVSQPVQVTNDTYYERGQAIRYGGGYYWLFYGRSATVMGNYGNDNPDVSDYQIYFKKATSVEALDTATVATISAATNCYLGEIGAAYFDGKIWAFATVPSTNYTSRRSLYGWYSTDGASWTEVADIADNLSDGAAHHDEIASHGKIYVTVNRGATTNGWSYLYSSTPETGGWSAEQTIPVPGNGLAHFFIDTDDSLYLGMLTTIGGATNRVLQYNGSADSWTELGNASSSGWDPTLFKVRSDYIFAQAPWSSGRQWVIAWYGTDLSTMLSGSSKMVSEGQYGTNVWVEMWPIGFTDEGGNSYLFYTSERNPDDPSSEITGNIWYLKVDWGGSKGLTDDHYTYIQEAIDGATDGDVIEVAAGTFNVATQVIIDKALTLIGENAATTIIDGPASSVAIPCEGLIAVDGVSGSVTIKNFTLQDAPERAATWEIYLLAVKNMPAGASVTIEDNILIGRDDSNAFDGGIWIAEGSTSSQATIRNNDLSKVYRGIVMERMLGPSTVENNDIHHLVAGVFAPDTYAAQGLYYLTYTGDVTTQQLAKENRFRDYAGYDILFQGGHAFMGDGKFTNVKIQDNTVNAIGSGPEDAHVGIILYNYPATDLNACGVHNAEITGNTITTGGTDSKGVAVHGQNTSIDISNNEIANLGTGILVQGTGTPDVTVNGNSITGNTVMGFNNTTAFLMNASGNWWGINTPSGVAGEVSTYVDYTPWLHSGTDLSGDPGFQPDLSYLHVDDTSPQTGTIFRIQEGVDMVTGSTVYVQNGTYGADPATGRGVYITKDGLSLIGESETGTIIDGAIGGVGSSGSYWPKGIHVQANNVTVQNFTVQGFTGDLVSTGGYGVLHRDYAHDTEGEGWIFYDGCTVDNVTVQNCYSVVYALCFTHLTVLNCNLNNNFSDGMFIARGSDYATIHDNTVTNSGDHGIWVGNCWMGLRPSHDATIYNNTVNGAREGGISFVGSNNAVIHHNSITNAAGDGWSVGALSLKDGPTNVEAHHNTIFNNSGTWNGYNGTGHGVGIDGAASNIDLHHNSIYGNSGLGVYNGSSKDLVGSWERRLSEDGNLPTFDDMVSLGGNKGSKALVLAEQNWWGAYCGPYHPTTNLNGQGDEVSDNVDYEPWCDSTFSECSFTTTAPSIVWVDDDYTPLGTNDGHYWCYDAFDKIQDGVDVVAIGGTVNVAAGMYEEQVEIDKAVTLIGAGSKSGLSTSTIIKSPVSLTYYFTTGSNDNYPIVGIHDAIDVIIRDCQIDGASRGNSNYRFCGIAFWNAGGSIIDCYVTGVRDDPFSGAQHGIGIYSYNNTGGPYAINVTGTDVDDFQKNGVALSGDGLSVNVTGCTVTGHGPTGVTAQNGIQISWGAGGTVTDCSVSGIAYTGEGWIASGMLFYLGTTVDVSGVSSVSNSQANIVFQGTNGSVDGAVVTTSGVNNEEGVSIRDYGYSKGPGGKISFVPVSPLEEELYEEPGQKGAPTTVTLSNLNLTGAHEPSSYGIAAWSIGDNVTVSVTQSNIQDWEIGIVAYEDGSVVDVTATSNNISSNDMGFWTNAASLQNATGNWWGDASGPLHTTTNSDATGDEVSDNVDYSAWWSDNYVDDPHADPWTWYVNTSNSSTIQEGIDAATSLDTVRVRPGTYVENDVVDKSLALLGAGQDSVLVYPAISDIGMPNPDEPPSFRGSQMCVVEASDVTIDGFTFDGDNPTLTLSGTIDARNGIITHYNTGDWSNLKVRNCTVKNIYLRGIYASAQTPNNLTGVDFNHNTVSNVKGWSMESIGIMLWGSSGEVKHNNVSDASVGIFYHWYSDGNMDSNTVTTSELGLGVNSNDLPTSISHNSITDSDQGIQTVAVDAAVNVGFNHISACTSGVVLYGGGTDETNVWDNDIEGLSTYDSYGVWASTDLSPWGLGDLTANLKRNTIEDNFYGIVLNEPSGDQSKILSVLIGGAVADYNLIYNNINYELLMEYCNDDQNATYNYWSYSSFADIEDEIFHQVDQASFGLVTFDPALLHGDVNLDGIIDLGDVLYLVSYLYNNGSEPQVALVADVNRDETLDMGDMLYLISYLYKSGPPPLAAPSFSSKQSPKKAPVVTRKLSKPFHLRGIEK